MTESSRTFLSLFSGCGGFDLGFANAGFKNIGSIDIDERVLRVNNTNLGSPVFQSDLSGGNLPNAALGKFDVLISGSPCQGFSTIGKRRIDDPRNNLLLVAGKIAARYKPRVVLAENVPGVISGKHKEYWKELHRMLRESGYQTTDLIGEGVKLGVPQRRKRLFLIAWRLKRVVTLELPTVHGGVLRDALANIDGLPNHDPDLLALSSDEYKIAQKLAPGQKLCNVRDGERAVHTWQIPEVYGRTNELERRVLGQVLKLRRRVRVRDFGDADPVGTALLHELFGVDVISRLEKKGYLRQVGHCHDLVGTFNGKFRRLRLDEPSYTVDTRFGDPRCFLHPTEHRGFSPREAARIQGFPDSFVFSGTKVEQFRMIGNAVPPPMAQNLASLIRGALL